MTLSAQFATMLSMTAGGFYLGIILDTYRRLSIYWKGSPFMIYAMEIVFWLSQTMLLYYVLFLVNSGELRVYVFLACLLGFSMYKGVAANAYQTFLEHIIRMVAAVYRFCRRTVQILVIIPVKAIILFMSAVAMSILRAATALVRWLVTIVFTPVFWLFRLLYSLLPSSFQKKLYKIAGFYSKIENICRKWIKELWFRRR
ncbi:spore cortex biosynthesis protein YabQ [Lentibacillus halophilus]|uniref:Spore cortex biosynthesis protein YabQ n=1 Tax=Lentibacillus halophilus TaxID=295065 RepID=A0ABN0ZA27_9BACI